MPYIRATTDDIWWAVGNPVVAAGLTEVPGMTVTGLVMYDDIVKMTFLQEVSGHVTDYEPLPDYGQIEKNTIYGYNSGLVISKKNHYRMKELPAEAPTLWVIFEEQIPEELVFPK